MFKIKRKKKYFTLNKHRVSSGIYLVQWYLKWKQQKKNLKNWRYVIRYHMPTFYHKYNKENMVAFKQGTRIKHSIK